MSRRNGWFDALRTAAILAVVTYHVVQMSPLAGSALAKITAYGKYGVDLFFVLSGWLIGSLFWEELAEFGNVQLLRFWARRALRTIPPYLIALTFSWGAVAHHRSEPFDPGYLLFLQNYYERIPFFLVSWSLCVEEHFYLVAPVLSVLLLGLFGARALQWALPFLLVLSPLSRAFEFRASVQDVFGYATTATHLRLDGLVIGFAASFVAIRWPEQALQISKSLALKVGISAALIAAMLLEIEGGQIWYTMFPTVLALMFGLGVAHGLYRETEVRTQKIAGARLIRQIALSSYATYLLHPLAIHATLYGISEMQPGSTLLYWPVVISSIVASTVVFYFVVERPSISFRDALIPRRMAPSTMPSRMGVTNGLWRAAD
jgi:peptidoglycan/LPS O-acetylase OafA/YrhL